LKGDDPNFSINYRGINNIEYIEIKMEPDVVEAFMALVPNLGQPAQQRGQQRH
jgi:hypothetical protein